MPDLERLTDAICKRLFIEIEASGRHVHLSESDALALFGHPLTEKRPLSQPGQFACNERVILVGAKGKLERVAVLGPARPHSQVEISLTDARTLGVDAPVRLSGDIDGTPGIRILGDAGEITLSHGVIVAKRHLHMSPEDAAMHALTSGDEISLRCLTARPLILEGVAVRVDNSFATYAHIDFDEANAAGFRFGDLGEIFHG